MFDGIHVNHGGVEQAAADLAQTVQRIDDRLNRLEGELEPLRSQWSGQQQQAYTQAKATWDQAIIDMKDLLQQTSLTVTDANANFRQADLRGAAAFGG